MRSFVSKLPRGWYWPLALAAAICVASSRSDVAAPGIPHIDKATHFAVYGLLATLVVRLRPGLRHGWLAVAAVALFGVADEWHQSFTPGREVEVADWIADTLGATVAMLAYTGWTRYRAVLELPLRRNVRIETPGAAAPVSAQ